MLDSDVTIASPESRPELSTDVRAIYVGLKDLLARDDLPPGVRANLQQALSAVWQVVNNLALDYEYLYDLGV